MRSSRWIWLALGVAVGGTSCTTLAPIPAAVASSGAWSAILQRHVGKDGSVEYDGLRNDRARLEAAYANLAATVPPPTGPARLAHWIDAYNLAVLIGVIRLDVRESVLEIPAPFLLRWFVPDGAGFFYFPRFRFAGDAYSLYALEHEVIRGFGDYRIHFAINCASRSCPPLERTPFSGDDIDRRLDAATARFVADEAQVSVDPTARRVRVNPILAWFAEDFPEPLALLARHAAGPKKVALERARDEAWPIEFVDYDWRLNRR